MAIRTPKPNISVPKRKPLSKAWRQVLGMIPGYDPEATAGDAWFEAAPLHSQERVRADRLVGDDFKPFSSAH